MTEDLLDIVKTLVAAAKAQQEFKAEVSDRLKEYRELFEALQVGIRAGQQLHLDHTANTLLFRAVIAFLVADAAPETRAGLSALLDRPIEGLDPSSDLAISVRKAADDLKQILAG
jgi:hypothetical protein